MISNYILVLKIHSLYTATEKHTYRAGTAAVGNVCRVDDWSLLAQEGNMFCWWRFAFDFGKTDTNWNCVRAESEWRDTCGRKRENKVCVPHVYLTIVKFCQLDKGTMLLIALLQAKWNTEDQIYVNDIQVTWEVLQSCSSWRRDLGSIVPQSSQVSLADAVLIYFHFVTLTLL